jgi:hypothetical protein
MAKSEARHNRNRLNAAATCYLLSRATPLAFMEAWTKALETTPRTTLSPRGAQLMTSGPQLTNSLLRRA